jgi:predicted nuclease with TOPRIM domain
MSNPKATFGGEAYQEKIKRLEAENAALREVVEAADKAVRRSAEYFNALIDALDKLDEEMHK